ncbi:MAG: hypothetical protein MJ057_05865 [Sphaerochaetaceae bacterium]|nr:hypothetical protein [Sphaerochaetaceae bacterium]
MADQTNVVRFPNVLRLAGVCVAGGIGCGFATGQEVMQFFSAQGILSIAGTVISTLFFAWMGAMFLRHGHDHKLDTPIKTFQFYYGNRLGKVIELLIQLLIFGIYVIMVSGGGAILYQCFGVPQVIGRTVLVVLGFLTVSLGLAKFMDLISFIGTALALVTVVFGVISFIPKAPSLADIAKQAMTLEITKTKGGWLWSSILYPSFNSLALIIMCCRVGCEANSKKEATIGGALGGVLFGLAIFAQNLGLLSNLPQIYATDIPTVALIETISPTLATILAATIFVGIYSASIPMLWSIGAHFAEDRTRKFILITLVLSVLTFLLGSVSNFKSLINTIYPFSGYFALTLLVLIAVREYQDRKGKRKAAQN